MHPDRKPRRDDEDQLQIAVVAHLRLRAYKNVIWYMVPNGTAKSRAVAGKAKAMGLRPGVSDLAFVMNDGTAAFLELKTGNNKASPEQVEFGMQCERVGAAYAIVWNIDQALAVLEAWQILKPSRA